MDKQRKCEVKELSSVAILTAVGASVGAIAVAPKAGQVVKKVVDVIRGKE